MTDRFDRIGGPAKPSVALSVYPWAPGEQALAIGFYRPSEEPLIRIDESDPRPVTRTCLAHGDFDDACPGCGGLPAVFDVVYVDTREVIYKRVRVHREAM
jgi:hypothetical protein